MQTLEKTVGKELQENKTLLVQSQNYLETVFDVIPNIIITTDGETVDKANRAMLQFFGYETLEDFKKEHDCICDFFGSDESYIQAKMGDKTWLEYILSYPNQRHKVSMAQGSKVHHFIVQAELLKVYEKHRSVVVFFDVTEIEESSAFLNSVISSIDNLIFVKDKEFKYLHCNKAFEAFIGRGKAELIGKDDYQFFPKEEADYFRGNDQQMMLDGIVQRSEAWIRYANGEKKYLLTTISPIYDSDGGVLGLVGNSVDLAKQKRLEQEIIEKENIMIAQSRQAAMGEMISMIAHQWRQPLATISMGANNILADIELDMLNTETLRNGALDIVKRTQELSKTIEDFRNFFKPSQEITEVLVEDVFKEAYGIIDVSFKNSAIEVTLEMKSVLKIKTYSRELMQVFLNILKNAKEALVENQVTNKHIYVFTEDGINDITIKICDNAKGIKEEIMGRIFEPYFSTKNEKNGIGLGLYMSKTIIEKHLQGSLRAYNKNQGVCFEITLPHIIKEDKL